MKNPFSRTKPNTAIEFLMSQHREVDVLFEKIEAARGATKAKLFRDLADALAIHATIEEEIFYPAAFNRDRESMLREAVEEHLSAKRIITDIMNASPTSENWDAKVSVLKEQIRHHVREEETEMFPRIRTTMTTEQLEELGGIMESRAGELFAAGNPRMAIPQETDRARPLRPVEFR